MCDDELQAAIRREIAASPFVGEGHKKICARLRLRGIRTSLKRVLRLTREAGLLAPTPQVRKRTRRLHQGKITVDVPDTLWATDATESHTRHEGRCAVFAIIDHATHRRGLGRRRPADGPLGRRRPAQGGDHRALRIRRRRGRCRTRAALRRRTVLPRRSLPGRDRPPRHRRSPAYHYEPETNGCVEKFIQTLKEQVLWIERFD
jgi:hypothetical protein